MLSLSLARLGNRFIQLSFRDSDTPPPSLGGGADGSMFIFSDTEPNFHANLGIGTYDVSMLLHD